MKNTLAIMVMGYNRPNSLKRVLNSLLSVEIDGTVPLIISIDAGGDADVIKIANEFEWVNGEKEVLVHNEKLGLKKHFFFSGDLTEKYENVLFIEDDLIVSPACVKFADQFISEYADEERVAGASLYDPAYMEGLSLKFNKLEDGYDIYFFQQPYWGNVWMKDKWKKFKDWYQSYEYKPELLPSHVAAWQMTSFKKVYIQYLIETNRYFVTPRVSLATNCADPGLHIRQQTTVFQCPFAVRWDNFRFCSIDDSLAIYDAFFEIVPDVLKKVNPKLENYDFAVNLYGRKKVDTPYVITTMNTEKAILSFSDNIKPWELAIVHDIYGEGVCLSKVENVIYSKKNIKNQLGKDIIKHYGIDMRTVTLLCFSVLKRKMNALKARIKRAKR